MNLNIFKILLLLQLLSSSLYSQVSEYEFKAAALERFSRFIDWPHEIENSTFKIAVIGTNPFQTSLDDLLISKKIKNKKVEIIYTNNFNQLSDVNLVFISRSEKKKINDILNVISQKPILIISDTKGFGKMGTHINMYNEGSYIRYEINREAIAKSGLKVTSLLLASAKIVETNE